MRSDSEVRADLRHLNEEPPSHKKFMALAPGLVADVPVLLAQRDQARGIAVDLEQQLAAAPSPAAVLRDVAAVLDELGERRAAQVVLGIADKHEAKQ